jgi:hypothetical protein
VRHDDLIRYATGDKLLEYVRQYKIETEALVDGVPGLLQRRRALDALADTISLDWRPVIRQLQDGTEMVTLQPKHSDALKDAPITFRFTTAFPADPGSQALHDQIRDSFDLGTKVEIPGSFVTRFTAGGPAGLGLPGPDAVLDKLVLGARRKKPPACPHRALASTNPARPSPSPS